MITKHEKTVKQYYTAKVYYIQTGKIKRKTNQYHEDYTLAQVKKMIKDHGEFLCKKDAIKSLLKENKQWVDRAKRNLASAKKWFNESTRQAIKAKERYK